MRHKLISVILTAFVLLLLPMTAFAHDFDADRLGSVSVTLTDRSTNTPIPGAELSLYRVASAAHIGEQQFSYAFTEAFKDCGCELDDPSLSAALDTFVESHSVSAAALVTDAQGTVSFTDLPMGLYFVKQTGTAAGYAPCASFLVTVPNYGADGYVYDVNASPKTDAARLTDITIQKVWNTDASAKAPGSVTVQLLRGGAVVETAVLNAQNGWQVTYADLPESDAYSIVEVDIPKGFTATYSQSGYVFTVTNSPALAQTGQLLWPIPVLAMAGLCLIAAGALALKKTRKPHA